MPRLDATPASCARHFYPRRRRPMRRLLIRPVRLAQDARRRAEEKEAKAKANAEEKKAKAEAKAVRQQPSLAFIDSAYTVLSTAHVPAHLPRPYALSPCGIRASPAQDAKQKLLQKKEEANKAKWVAKCEQLRLLGRRPVYGEPLYEPLYVWLSSVRNGHTELTAFRRDALDKALPSWNDDLAVSLPVRPHQTRCECLN